MDRKKFIANVNKAASSLKVSPAVLKSRTPEYIRIMDPKNTAKVTDGEIKTMQTVLGLKDATLLKK